MPYVGRRGQFDLGQIGCLAARFDPGFDFLQVPHNAARGEVDPSRKLAAPLHVVDRGVCQWHDLSELVSADGRPQRYPAGMSSGLREGDRRILRRTKLASHRSRKRVRC